MKTLTSWLLVCLLSTPLMAQMVHLDTGQPVTDIAICPHTQNVWVLISRGLDDNEIHVYNQAHEFQSTITRYAMTNWGRLNKIIFNPDNAEVYILNETNLYIFNQEDTSLVIHEVRKVIRQKFPNRSLRPFYTMLRTADHFWISLGAWTDGTSEGGLVKVNAHTYAVEKIFLPNHTSPWPNELTTEIFDLLEDSTRNRLWVTTDSGLYLFDTQTETWTNLKSLWNRTLPYEETDPAFHSVNWNHARTKILATHYRGRNSTVLEIDPDTYSVKDLYKSLTSYTSLSRLGSPFQSSHGNIYAGNIYYLYTGAYLYEPSQYWHTDISLNRWYDSKIYRLKYLLNTGSLYWWPYNSSDQTGNRNSYDMGGVTRIMEIDGHIWTGTLNGLFIFPDPGQSSSAVEDLQVISSQPKNFVLEQNYPNPFNSSTRISYSLPRAEHITLKVYDVQGRLVETLADERQNAGNYSLTWIPESHLGSGIYLVTLTTHSGRKIVKSNFIK